VTSRHCPCDWYSNYLSRPLMLNLPILIIIPMLASLTNNLDMELFWQEDDSLAFRVHLKPNQKLQYLNMDSTHTKPCLKAIPNGVLNRPAKPTTPLPTLADKSLDKIYPHHLEKLHQAGLLSKPIPTLSQERDRYLTSKTEGEKTDKRVRERGRQGQYSFVLDTLEHGQPQSTR
jgi:hypothetical protein